MAKELTARQDELLKYIVIYTLENCYQPSIREMAEFLGCTSSNNVSGIIKALVRKGYLEGSECWCRALEITDKTLYRAQFSNWTTPQCRLLLRSPRNIL